MQFNIASKAQEAAEYPDLPVGSAENQLKKMRLAIGPNLCRISEIH